MDTSKVYLDSKGNECSIWQMVRREPDWAANVLQAYEKKIEKLNSQLKKMHQITAKYDSQNSTYCTCERCTGIKIESYYDTSEDAT